MRGAISAIACAIFAAASIAAELTEQELLVFNPGSALVAKERIGGGQFKVLVYGNSIALHRPLAAAGWTNCCGMAASSPDKDFAHLVVAGLEARRGEKADFRIRNLAVLERNFTTNIATIAEIAADAAWSPDYVVIALGENAPEVKGEDAARYQKFLVDLVVPFSMLKRRPKIVMRSQLMRSSAVKAQCTRNAAAAVGAAYVDAGPLGLKDENLAIGRFKSRGVANHPGDLGMRRLADLILAGFDRISSGEQ